MSIHRKKTLASVVEHASKGTLKRTLGVGDLILMGLGAIIGTGIFVVTGVTAAELSGPGVTISYLVAGLSAIFIALAYTEVATIMPTSGGVFAYAYVVLGEISAWVVGWMTLFYLIVSAAAVSSGWSGYVVSIIEQNVGIPIPDYLVKIPSEGGLLNLPAAFIVLLVTLLLIKGTKESAKLNGILVFVKIFAVGLFVVLALPHFNINLWFDHKVAYDSNLLGSSDFLPYGYQGVFAGAGFVFFGYNGFDALANATEEAKNPERDVTIAILFSLILCMLLYMLVAGLLVGIAPYSELNLSSPLAYALNKIGSDKGSLIVSVGAVAGMTTVILLQMYAQSRMLFVMSRDGLVPKIFSKVHEKFHTPHYALMIPGVIIATIGALCPLEIMAGITSMVALFSFTVVSIIMLILRRTMPKIKRPFKCPLAYIIAPIAITVCSYLIFTLVPIAGIYFVSWFVIGIFVYFAYVRNHSILGKEK